MVMRDPVVKDVRHDRAGPGDDVTFVGTATTVIRLGAFTLLTDPNFLHQGQRAYLGKGLWSRRQTEPALSISDLPPLDAVILSHLHGDHFDRVARRGLDRSVPVVTTPHAEKHLTRWGFATHALQTWEKHEQRQGGEVLSVESMPAIHARGVMGRLLPPVMGSLLEHWVDGELRRRVYISGDTLTGSHLDEIHRRYPEIDVAIVHLGGTRVLLHTVTMDAVQGVDFLGRIRPGTAVPVHFNDYRVFRSSIADFARAADRSSFAGIVQVPFSGQTLRLDS